VTPSIEVRPQFADSSGRYSMIELTQRGFR
jgi:hypothetical protein